MTDNQCIHSQKALPNSSNPPFQNRRNTILPPQRPSRFPTPLRILPTRHRKPIYNLHPAYPLHFLVVDPPRTIPAKRPVLVHFGAKPAFGVDIQRGRGRTDQCDVSLDGGSDPGAQGFPCDVVCGRRMEFSIVVYAMGVVDAEGAGGTYSVDAY
jgi:hypothetical protein